ncbi:MAG: UDP-galactose-lipid carrier transferase [Leptospiraceae bacterium]|nr:UDP-galactose-lipid carrier transferase [Leptospiraceae bacterium]MBK7057951.1 UDP-galactose-lipid carrier transferase [Leptospiraceae bacterium]MBK9501899.1 UDP-galactose-lipid carrier transferase [Leptospiraceae bacterium]MBL0266686.1 UDP-galactose-lipid carrier transferase [Leptospiraceae bacterium]MBP9164821.1 UDP-galactose-lipid carrier transferase [Leptospiraceae bacterium]
MNDKLKFQSVTFSETLNNKDYKKQIDELQERARLVSHYSYKKKRSIILVFEGWDAAGKGGAIRRLTSRIDPRLYTVSSIAAPNEVERNHHYLWRFWNKIPAHGNIGIFDRSWYGRVLVERVEGFTSEENWQRAFGEIVNFEDDLSDSGAIIIKYWLHVSSEEQLKRFNARKDDPLKRWKLTEEDWRNRDKWPLYEEAAEEAFSKTHKPNAPWHIIPANDKYFARTEVLRIFCDRIENELNIPSKFS